MDTEQLGFGWIGIVDQTSTETLDEERNNVERNEANSKTGGTHAKEGFRR